MPEGCDFLQGTGFLYLELENLQVCRPDGVITSLSVEWEGQHRYPKACFSRQV